MNRADRDESAAGWVVRMEEPGWGPADEMALQAWLAADPKHFGALLQAQALWAAFDYAEADAATGDRGGAAVGDEMTGGAGADVGAAAEGASSATFDEDHDLGARRGLTRRWVLGTGGAAIAASIAGGVFFLRDARYATAVGEIRRVPLADGSVASINTDSAVVVELAGSARRVELSKGEAWFQVAKDSKRPFIVAAGRVRAQAVGTAFSVRRREGGADILVTEGIVEAWADGAEGNKVRLAAGQSAFVADNAAIKPATAVPGSVDRALAWRSGKIDLVSMPLASAAAEFNRYNARQIVIADPSVGAEQLDGVFGINDPETFAIAVRDGLSVPVDLRDPAVIRIGRARP